MATTVEITTTTTAKTTSQVVDLTGTDAKTTLAAFVAAKAAIKQLEAQKDSLEQQLRELLGDADSATFEGTNLYALAHSRNSSFDRELMKTAFPEAFDACLKTKPYTFIKTL